MGAITLQPHRRQRQKVKTDQSGSENAPSWETEALSPWPVRWRWRHKRQSLWSPATETSESRSLRSRGHPWSVTASCASCQKKKKRWIVVRRCLHYIPECDKWWWSTVMLTDQRPAVWCTPWACGAAGERTRSGGRRATSGSSCWASGSGSYR